MSGRGVSTLTRLLHIIIPVVKLHLTVRDSKSRGVLFWGYCSGFFPALGAQEDRLVSLHLLE